MAFGLIMYLALQREQRLIDDDQTIMERIWPYFLLDAIWSQYMMALEERGDAPDVFDSHPWKYTLYFIFFLITVATQILYLNMIIAFMSDSFDCMMEQKPILSLK